MNSRKLLLASGYGAVATVCASAGVSTFTNSFARTSPPWAGDLSLGLIGAALALFLFAYVNWRGGIDPRPPTKPLLLSEAIGLIDDIVKLKPKFDSSIIINQFLQDARDGRIDIWGRVPQQHFVHDMVQRKAPLVYIAREYWSDSYIDWTRSQSESDRKEVQVFVDLCVRKSAFSRLIWLNRMRRRYSSGLG